MQFIRYLMQGKCPSGPILEPALLTDLGISRGVFQVLYRRASQITEVCRNKKKTAIRVMGLVKIMSGFISFLISKTYYKPRFTCWGVEDGCFW